MRKTAIAIATFVGLALSSVNALAAIATVEGTVSGYTCAVLGKACPVDREDPVIAAERMFVVVRPDGSYFMVPNVDRAILARHLTEKIRVTGNLDDKYKAISADKIEAYVAAKNSWKTVWSAAMEDEARAMLYGN